MRKTKKMISYLPPSDIDFEVANEEGKFHNLFFVSLFLRTFIEDLSNAYGVGLKNNFVEIKNQYLKYVVDTAVFDKAAQHYFNLTKTKPSFAKQVNENLFKETQQVNLLSKELLSTDFSRKTNAELVSYVERYSQLMQAMITWGMLPVVMEIRSPVYTDFLTSIVDKKNREMKANISISEAVAVLSSFDGETEAKHEQRKLLKLAIKIKQSNNAVENLLEFQNELEKHAAQFGWLAYGYGGPAWKRVDYEDAIRSILKENPEKMLEELEHNEEKLAVQKQLFESKLCLTDLEKTFFAIGRDFMKGKALRREAMSFAAYGSEPLHKEIAKRLNLSFLQVRFMLFEEMKRVLNGEKVDENELTKRTKYVIYGLFNHGEDEVIATGKDAEKYSKLIAHEEIDLNLKELTGTCACPGKAMGAVKLIHRPEDMSKMQKGDVLVSYATTPDIVSAMRLASAIVTDMGGLTSHAAIVSREMNIPCIIGTKIATKFFKDGDNVAVDATSGIVKKV